jgi:hypothetical protein
MSDKSSLLRAFNTHLIEFMDDVISIFPENTDLISSKKTLDLLKRANPSIIIKMWNSRINTKYYEEIMKGDAEYFFNKDYREDVDELSNSNEILRMIDVLREPVKNTSAKNKENAMEYVMNLSKIAKIYSEM